MMNNNDLLVITHGWSENRQCNVFGVRGFGPSYDKLYKDIEKPGEYRSILTLSADFPWHYFTFYEEADAVNFRISYLEFILEDQERPPKTWVRPPDFGDLKWCTRCRKFHEVRDPNLPPLEEELASILAAEIAREIDAEILKDLRNALRKTNS
jgi:hypothetical protein